jgi:diguanylate cyclase (GGDEF)-like protein
VELSSDSLTGLPNLIALVDDVRELPAGRGALVLADLSDLSAVNETHGRPVGTQVIQALAMAFGQPYDCDPGPCRAYRTGGDEVTLILEACEPAMVEHLVEARQARFQQELRELGLPGMVFRYAVANYPDQGTTLSALLACVYVGINPSIPASSRGNRWVEGLLAWFIRRLAETLDELRRTRELALTDLISGLPNYRAVQDVVERAVRQHAREPAPFAVLFIDGDNLKQYNDQLGYVAGNGMIQRLARLLREGMRTGDFVGRWLSGDEFLAVLPGADRDTAQAIAERLRALVEEASASWPLPVTVSIGVAACPEDSSEAEVLLNSAATASALAKQRGKNRVAQAPRGGADG